MQGWQNQNQGWGHQQNVGHIQSGSETSGNLSPPFNPNQDVAIVSAMDPNMVLDVSSENKLIIWKKHGMKNQRWRISQQNGKYALFNFSGGIAGVPNNSKDDCTIIEVNQPKFSDSELWEFVQAQKDTNNGYAIKSFCGKCLYINE